MRTTVRELSELVGGELHGDGSCEITGVSSIEEAMPGDLVFAQDSRYLRAAGASAASAIVAPPTSRNTGKPLILVEDPKYAFARILQVFAPSVRVSPGIDPGAHVGSGFNSGIDVSVQFGSFIGENVTMGDRVTISPHAYIADDVKIGSDVVIHPFVAVHQGVEIGDRVTIHSGTVIGSDGFGYVMVDAAHQKIPQIGNVVIGDDVEIGANTAIDRARTGSTIIGSGAKIDNLVHIAHNVKIGRNCLVIALVGVAGSVNIGDGVTLAGQAGVKDHVDIGDNVVVAARAGVIGDIAPGSQVSGFPARDHREQMRATAAMHRVPELLKQISRLEERIAALEGQTTGQDT
jgi:UDP-3-O-[3-hydroxymyristoyl] glucosamine N-acyltransferase